MLRFTGRAAQLAEIETVLRKSRPEPVIVTGGRGIGRTALLREVTRLVAPTLGATVVVDPRPTPPAPASPPGSPRVVSTAAAIRAAAQESPPPVFILDDAHQAPQQLLLSLRDAHRTFGAGLVISRPDASALPTPDPIDCLLYEPDLRIMELPTLTRTDVGEIVQHWFDAPAPATTVAALHAAAGGLPAVLRELLLGLSRSRRATAAGRPWQLGSDPSEPLPLPDHAREQLLRALRDAWRLLDLELLPDLSLLALRAGARAEAAPVWALVCLLRDETEQGLRLLEGLSADEPAGPGAERILMARALLLTVGAGRVDEAGELLLRAARQWPAAAARMHALRMFLRPLLNTPVDESTEGLTFGSDPQAAVFARAAVAMSELAGARPRRAIPHLRRAIIGAETLRDELPWLVPYLTGALIDALLLAGRLGEATEKAAEFHADRHGSGWDVAVSLSALITRALAVRDREPA
ncbi:hypothetical protein [Micromonospora sp. NBS 11-29]|uniref:hypothetical protein n=1 Tax=Micromonospora sp. NBS 11-29 TaxID=1960879 RepID=UPI000B79053E|nr:hypothetical protein [Micromonospora sp. NBS 11-29]